MTTTIVRDSIVGDDWITRTMQSVPIQRVINQTTGEPTGDILTGPVRLAFCNLFELPPKQQGQQSEPKYGSAILFPPGADLTIMYEEYYKACGQTFPDYYDAGTQQYHGLNSPFRDQAEKLKFGGFTPGGVFMTCTSKYKPPITDTRHNPIVDPNKVYPGVWAICSINAYTYGKNPPQPKKGVAFGLQSVMIIGDDTQFGGGAPDPKETFAGVNVTAPIVRPDMAQGMGQGSNPHAPAPAAGIPGYTQPGGGVAPQQARPPAAPGGVTPPAGFTPPATAPTASPQSGMPPGQPSAPPATTSPSDDEDMSFLS